MISFVFYFSSKRLKNLQQTLRFLEKRENLKNHEVILVCNDNITENFSIPNYKLINLNLQSYNKPKMCNLGVKESSNEIICLLDSDRILPENYFENNANKIKRKQFISTTKLIKLIKDYSDDQIENKEFKYLEDTKSKKGEILKKNLFSGNTIFYKQDYLDCGSMDESFVGYGFADNDMNLNIVSKGYKAIWLKDLEIHLYHNTEFLFNNKTISEEIEFKKISAKNLDRFIEKWNNKNISNFIRIK